MKHKRLYLPGLLVALGALAILIYAAAPDRPRHDGPRPSPEEHFATADRDGNGTLSEAEFTAAAPHPGPHAADLFARLDANHDGALQMGEIKAAHREHFRKADVNGDGKLSHDEFLVMADEHPRGPAPWERLDQNGRGKLQRSEMQAAHEKNDDMPPPPPAGREEHGRPQHPRFDPETLFAEADANGDGVLDQSELEAQHARMREQAFTRMDENKDGFLDENELKPPMGPGGHGPGAEPRGEKSLRDDDAVGLATTAGVSAAPLTAPDRFLLAENYPNPFNNATTLRYDLPEAANVMLAVYNVAGERVKTLVNEHQPSGHYQLEVTLPDQTSGTYFCRMQAGAFSAVTRMTYLK